MQYFVHAANLLFLGMYLVRDILWLRVIAVLAGVTLYPYQVWITPHGLWNTHPLSAAAPLLWNTLFNVINIVQLKRLIVERRPVRLSASERALYEAVFARLSPREFLRLLSAAESHAVEAGMCLVEQDAALDRLLLIRDGEVAVRVGEREVALLGSGRFVGEMSFLTRDRTSASVWARGPTEYLTWPRQALDKLFEKHPDMRATVQLVLGEDLARKLKAA
jgi:hypothetical protein